MDGVVHTPVPRSVEDRFEVRRFCVRAGLHNEYIQRTKVRIFQTVNLLRKS